MIFFLIFVMIKFALIFFNENKFYLEFCKIFIVIQRFI